MSNTYNRRPYYVDIPSDTTGFFVQSRFNGIKTNQNDVEIDQMSFIDAENVYVDEGGALVSRPPFKFSEGETNIIEQWNFGAYTLRLYRLYSFSTTVKGFWNIGTTYTKDDLAVKPGTNDLYMYINDTSTSGHGLTDVTYWRRYITQQVYVLRCISHVAVNEYAWRFPETLFGTDKIPKIKCVAIEDKIFIWFAGVDFIVFDLSTLTFEKATKYIYLPICKTVINGIENDLEAANFLTSAYRKRYLYSAISSINFDKLVGKRMSVYLNGPMTQNTSGYLYDITVGANQKNLLVYPYSDVGNYHIETVQTDVALVTLRYDTITKLIEISFDGMYFRSVPRLEDIVGVPQLSRDGMWLFAFTRTGLAKCRLVAQETLDFEYPERVLGWSIVNYCELDTPPLSLLNQHKKQVGYFETGDCYSYVINLADRSNLFYTQFWAKDALDNSVLIGRKETLNETAIIPAGQLYCTYDTYVASSLEMINTLRSGDSTCVMHHQYIMRDTDVDPGILAVLYADNFGVVWIRATYSADSETVTLDKGVITYNADQSSCFDPAVTWPDIYVEYPTSGRAKCRLSTRHARHRGDFNFDGHRLRSFNVNDFITTGIKRYRCIKYVPLEIPLENTEFVLKISNSKGFYDGSKSYNKYDIVIDQTTGMEYQYINDTSVVANTIVGELANEDYWRRIYSIPRETYSTTKRYIDLGQEVIDDDGYVYYIIKHSSFHYTNTEYWEEVVGSTDVALTIAEDVFIEMIVGDTDIHDISEVVFQSGESSNYFKISRDSFITENYLYMNGATLMLPVVDVEYVRPLSLTDRGATYLIDGTIWTTTLDTMQSNTLELDEYVNCIIDGDDCELEACENVPDHAVTLDYHYFSYDNRLEATTIKRDSDHNIMLYLPNLNENVFTNRITNLHPLSATDLGVFTEKEIWYVSNPSMAPVKSKIPLGCREGNEIITALDGQALLFATPRGLTALAPQDFVATTEPSLKYLNDSIQVKYNPFYNGLVNNAFIAPDGYLPCVKITSYKYWILFYKYMSNDIYVLDTRDGSWWIWTTPYPIKSLYSDSRLHALFEVNYNQNVFNRVRTSMYAVPFIFADHELSSIGYYDDVVKNTISGVTEMITEGDVQRRVSYYASPDIDWHFLSQKLHFDKLNHYKAVKGININVAGDEVITAKMSTRAYRDFYHPESSIVVEIPINDLRTFSQRLNLLHLVNFQYKIENDTNEDTRGHLRLNSLSIKYERKEKIR